MVCAAPWKTCNCPWFNYQHIPDDDRLNDMRVPQPRYPDIEVIERGVGSVGDLIVPVRRTDGLADACAFDDSLGSLDSRASRVSRIDVVLGRISPATCTSGDRTNLVTGGISTLRTDADPEPDSGV